MQRGIRNSGSKKPLKKSRGASLRGQGTPAYPARLRSERVGRPWNCKLEKNRCTRNNYKLTIVVV